VHQLRAPARMCVWRLVERVICAAASCAARTPRLCVSTPRAPYAPAANPAMGNLFDVERVTFCRRICHLSKMSGAPRVG